MYIINHISCTLVLHIYIYIERERCLYAKYIYIYIERERERNV